MSRLALAGLVLAALTGSFAFAADSLVGSWQVEMDGVLYILQLNADGTGTMGAERITWKAEGGNLVLGGGGGAPDVYAFRLDGDSLTLSGEGLEEPMTFARQGAAAGEKPRGSVGQVIAEGMGAAPAAGSNDGSFENTPQGALARFCAAATNSDAGAMRECTIGLPDETIARLVSGPEREKVANATLTSCKVDGDTARLEITTPTETSSKTIRALRGKDGVWRLDFSERAAAKDAEVCKNNLRQLVTYLSLFASSNAGTYPGPGPKALTDLFNLPSPERSTCAGSFDLLLCPLSGEAWDDAHEKALRADEPACTSYECIDQKLVDGVTQEKWPIVWDRTPHPDGTRNVLLFGGSVETMGEEQFQEALRLWPRK